MTPGSWTGGSWTDLDCTSHLGSDAGNVAAVIIEFRVDQQYSSMSNLCFRRNGSTDGTWSFRYGDSTVRAIVPVDSNDIFEYYLDINPGPNCEVYLRGYLLSDECEVVTNRLDKSLASTGSWQDVDVSGDFTDTALAVFGFLNHPVGWSGNGGYVRKNGSTDNRTSAPMGWQGATCFVVGCDGSEIFEHYAASTQVDCYVWGAITDNVTFPDNGVDYSTGTTGSYVDTDFTSDVDAGDNGVFLQAYSTARSGDFGIRKNGETFDPYATFPDGGLSNDFYQNFWCPIDSDDIAEQKISHNDIDLYFVGHSTAPSSGTELIGAQTLAGISQSATAAVLAQASSNQSIGGISQSATATVSIYAAVTQAIASASQAATSQVLVAVAGTQTIAGISQSLSSGITASGSIAQTLGGISQSGNIGFPAITASIAQQLGGVSQAATSVITVQASSGQTLGAISQAATGEVVITASSAQSLATINQALNGKVAVSASIAQTLAGISQALVASGVLIPTIGWVATKRARGWIPSARLRGWTPPQRPRGWIAKARP